MIRVTSGVVLEDDDLNEPRPQLGRGRRRSGGGLERRVYGTLG